MERLKKLARAAEAKLFAFLDAQIPVVHTAWQAALSALVVSLLAARSSADVKAALIAAGAIFLSGLKAAYLKNRG
jgi:hypothetical protein